MIENGAQPKKLVESLAESLKVHGREALMPRIARAFERLAQREMRKNELVLSVAHERDAHAAKSHAKKFLEELNTDHKDIEVAVDETLIGGWRLEGRGILADHSFKKSLLEMYNRATA